MDVEEIEKAITKRTRAILAVHLFGRPMDMTRLLTLSRRHRLPVIEDGRQAFGARYQSKPVGSQGAIGCSSFYANRIITAGEGGAAVTSDPVLYRRLLAIRNLGQDGKPFIHPLIGANYKMTNLHAAVGLGQIRRLNEFVRIRRDIAADFTAALQNLPGIARLPSETHGDTRVYVSYSIELKTPALKTRLEKAFHRAGVETRPFLNVIFDLVGGLSLKAYARLAEWKRRKALDNPQQSIGFWVICSPKPKKTESENPRASAISTSQ